MQRRIGWVTVTIDRPSIRVKAMLIALNTDHSAHAVSLNPVTAENPVGYHRLIGGSVEFGESHQDAIRREVEEEVGATIEDLALLTVVESIYTVDGEPGHEIVFLYSGHLNPAPAAGTHLVENDGTTAPIVWRSLTGSEEALPLYPSAAQRWIPVPHDPQSGSEAQ
jgi:ADP-ribose pyrophosphatase YjhB (NUDIX family)